MGIRGLTSLLKKNTSGCITETTLDQISGSKLAIDTSILLYKYSSFNKINLRNLTFHNSFEGLTNDKPSNIKKFVTTNI